MVVVFPPGRMLHIHNIHVSSHTTTRTLRMDRMINHRIFPRNIMEWGQRLCTWWHLNLLLQVPLVKIYQALRRRRKPVDGLKLKKKSSCSLFLMQYDYRQLLLSSTCGNGYLFVNKRMFCSTSCSVAGNLINSVARLAIASQESCVINIAVHLPMPNCSPVDLYVSPVAGRHNATATRLFTWIHWRNLVPLFVKSGPTTWTMYSNVRLDILKFSFHQSSTKSPSKGSQTRTDFAAMPTHVKLVWYFLKQSRVKPSVFASTSWGVVNQINNYGILLWDLFIVVVHVVTFSSRCSAWFINTQAVL